MTRKPDDWMPLHIGEYHADTTHLTRDQHGAYMLLLMAYWRRGGPLPADDGRLAAIVKATPAEWRKMRPVMGEFFAERAGHWHQKRADAELVKANAMTKAKSEAGAAGGSSKWQHGPERAHEHYNTRSQRLAAARQKGTHTSAEWEAVVEIFGGKCVRCGAVPKKPVKDHILPIYRGGSDDLENLQPLCPPCNSAKGPEEKDHRQNALHNWRECLAKRLADARQMPAPLPLPSPETNNHHPLDGDDDGFAVFFQEFPKQENRLDALEQYKIARQKAPAEAILAGSKRYAAECKTRNTAHISPAAKWLAKERWTEGENTAAAVPEVATDPSWGSLSEKLTAEIGPENFKAYFAAARVADGDPVRIQVKNDARKDMIERKFPKQLRRACGDFVVEVAA